VAIVKPSIRSAALVTLALVAGLTSGCAASTTPQDPAEPAAIRAFADEMADRHGMSAQRLETLLLEKASHQPDIIEAISNPAEALPWHRYRGIFLTRERIEGGVAYWDEHRNWLAEVEARYGVPPHIVVAIIGIETYYGRYRGRHRVLDALRTLAFAYPPRADFFRGELEAFLQLTREESIDPTTPLGSYAGAMGVPQFISSSYRAYAVDFNGDGRRDLFNQPADAIGSVGRYFADHGWQPGAPIAVPAQTSGEGWRAYQRDGLKPRDTVAELQAAGIKTRANLAGGQPARLLELELEDGVEHWVTLDNFYVITRYNHSPLYAMAAWQLAEAIQEAKQ
jgi:membrane-bound lytic murein transglycosylase B